MRISPSQSRTTRRESRLGQYSREFSRILFGTCNVIDIFQRKRAVDFLFSHTILQLLSLSWMEISFFEKRARFFSFNLVLYYENEHFFLNLMCLDKFEKKNHFSWSSGKKLGWFSREFQGSRTIVELWGVDYTPWTAMLWLRAPVLNDSYLLLGDCSDSAANFLLWILLGQGLANFSLVDKKHQD